MPKDYDARKVARNYELTNFERRVWEQKRYMKRVYLVKVFIGKTFYSSTINNLIPQRPIEEMRVFVKGISAEEIRDEEDRF